jgi:hypothetical protein
LQGGDRFLNVISGIFFAKKRWLRLQAKGRKAENPAIEGPQKILLV